MSAAKSSGWSWSRAVPVLGVLATSSVSLSSDGFHPSDRGYEAWTNEVWKVIERTL